MKATPNNMKHCEAAKIGALARCSICGTNYSASAGDYWNRDPAKPVMCCFTPMVLVTRETRYRKVRLTNFQSG